MLRRSTTLRQHSVVLCLWGDPVRQQIKITLAAFCSVVWGANRQKPVTFAPPPPPPPLLPTHARRPPTFSSTDSRSCAWTCPSIGTSSGWCSRPTSGPSTSSGRRCSSPAPGSRTWWARFGGRTSPAAPCGRAPEGPRLRVLPTPTPAPMQSSPRCARRRTPLMMTFAMTPMRAARSLGAVGSDVPLPPKGPLPS